MVRDRRLGGIVFVFAIFMMGLGILASAGEPPVVTACGADPFLVTYGDTVTFWAEVADADEDVASVWIMYEMLPIMPLAETDTPGLWMGEWSVPDLPGVLHPGDYLLMVVAVDEEANASRFEPFILSITEHDPSVPLLFSPPDDAFIYRGTAIPFHWSTVPEATGYNFQIMFPAGETVAVELPFFITFLMIEPHIANGLPDGAYYWQVQALFSDGPGAWSAPSMFEKNSQHGPPVEVEGFVSFVDTDRGTLQIETAIWDGHPGGDRPEFDPGMWWCYTVQVTPDTLITKDELEIGLSDIAMGDHVLVQGWLDEEAWGAWRTW